MGTRTLQQCHNRVAYEFGSIQPLSTVVSVSSKSLVLCRPSSQLSMKKSKNTCTTMQGLHQTVTFCFHESNTSPTVQTQLTQRLVHKLRNANKNRWNGKIVFAPQEEGESLILFNTFTQQKEYVFGYKSKKKKNPNPDVWQLKNGDYFIEDNVLVDQAVCDKLHGNPYQTFASRGEYGCSDAKQLRNGNMLLCYDDELYEYNLVTGETRIHQIPASMMLQFDDGKILAVAHREVKLCTETLQLIYTVETDKEITAVLEISPGVVLLSVDLDADIRDVTHTMLYTFDTKTKKMEDYGSDKIRCYINSMLLLKNGVIVLGSGNYLYLMKDRIIIHTLQPDSKYYRELLVAIDNDCIGYTDGDAVCVFNTAILRVEKRCPVPKVGRFICFVFEK